MARLGSSRLSYGLARPIGSSVAQYLRPCLSLLFLPAGDFRLSHRRFSKFFRAAYFSLHRNRSSCYRRNVLGNFGLRLAMPVWIFSGFSRQDSRSQISPFDLDRLFSLCRACRYRFCDSVFLRRSASSVYMPALSGRGHRRRHSEYG